MKQTLRLFFIIFFFSLFITNVQAYTKADIIALTENINTCSPETESLISGMRTSYYRMLNERNISEDNLNIIYNNIQIVLNIIKQNNICSVDQKDNLSEEVKKELRNLYEKTNNIILSSPKYVVPDNSSSSDQPVSAPNTNVSIDTSTNEIKIYEDGVLSDVIKVKNKLNDVGLNHQFLKTIKVLIITLTILIILKLILKKNFIINSMLYVAIMLLGGCLLFSDKVSILYDTISLMSVKVSNNNKNLIVENQNIISYPGYGNKYATLRINNNQGDIYFGDNADILKKGIGQASSSYLPGENKKTILSGHNTGVLKELFNVKKQDKINIVTEYGNFIYEVKSTKIINNTDTEMLKKDYDLILYTCYPASNLYGNKRLIVFANLIASKWESNQ